MAKIWEVHYTTFSGAGSNEPQDTIGTGHLTSFNGTAPVVYGPLAEFSTRQGAYLDSSLKCGYDLSSVSQSLFHHSNYFQRSFVLWFYKYGTSGDKAMIWGEQGGGLNDQHHGIYLYNDDLRIKINNSTLWSGTLSGNGWHNVVITIDLFVPRTVAYLNGTQIVDSATVPSVSTFQRSIGGRYASGSGYPSCFLGYTATYNHILDIGEVQSIYISSLVDSNDPENFSIYASVTGTVFDYGGSPLEGADVTALDPATDTVVAHDTTSSGGQYELDFPSGGVFKIVASKPGIIGGRVVEAVVSGGQVVFNTG
jgi:hypothetical protein